MSQPAVTVIIPARDAGPTLRRTLAALRAQTLQAEFEVIVVDDGSRDQTPAIARQQGDFVRLISTGSSQGPGAARNLGVSQARSPVLAFTDADCFPAPGWLAQGLDRIADADLVQGRVAPDPTVPRTPFDRSLVVAGDGGFYQTANLFVRRELFDAVGGFRDWVLQDGPVRRWSEDRRRGRAARTPIGEDTLFAWTARRLGARSAFAPDALVHHAVVPGNLLDDVADRWHWARDMPGLARLVPELRRGTFRRRVFFSEVTEWFDLALVGLLGARLTGSWSLTLAAMPYIRHVRNHSRQWGPRERAAYALGAPVVEAATLAALLSGSVTWRSLVL